MNPDLEEQIARVVAQQPDLIRALVHYALRQRAAAAARRKRRAFVLLPPEDVEVRSRAERLRASVAGDDREHLRDVAVDVVRVLQDEPGLSLRQLRKAVRAERGRCADGDVDAAVAYLGGGVRRDPGPRSAWLHSLDVAGLPRDVRDRIGVGDW
jgi:hypothetical protein